MSINSYSQEVRYIRDTLYITLRSEQSNRSEVVYKGLVSGSEVHLLEVSEDTDYSLVSTQDGVEGWVQTQYLVDKPTSSLLLKKASAELTQLKEERGRLLEQLNTLESEYVDSQSTLESLAIQSSQQQDELSEIKAISSDVLTLDSENTGLMRLNLELKNQLQVMRVENKELQDSIENDKFLNGAYAVLIGVFITLLIPRLRRSRKKEWI